MTHHGKKNLLMTLKDRKGIVFHLVGIACLIWFAIRVLPAPQRSQYPCQKIAIPIAFGYIAFWGTLFVGLSLWIRSVKTRTAGFAPTFMVIIVIAGSISGMVFATNYLDQNSASPLWDPIPKDPMGTPHGINPGRVVWVWNPNATRSDLIGFWWLKENNDQTVISQMFSTGLKDLTGEDNDTAAWDHLFKYYNKEHGYDEVSYQPGEKIAIKINLNNVLVTYGNPYTHESNLRDASPYVVKALLRQLVNTVGVPQEDITIFDASRPMPNWFYNRVYYETYPAQPLIPEFPNIHYEDAEGGASGRIKVTPSAERVYFADGTDLTCTLPTCIVEAKYFINMPILKRHPILSGVTLSGKNLFGVSIEPVSEIHPYHTSGQTMSNPAPQVDLFADKHLGNKTVLYIGDGTFATKIDHKTIEKFQMFPFNNDWTNSLFFSQDPVAIDSVMYDFLLTEGTNPTEGSQNYLHQAAVPLPNVYDPEHDGIFLNESLGVHEHWDTTTKIFSSTRYSGPLGNGIDFKAYGAEYTESAVIITKPKEHRLYINGEERRSLPITLILGPIDVETQMNNISGDIKKVEFYLDARLRYTDNSAPYNWSWRTPSFFRHQLKVQAYYDDNQTVTANLIVWKFL